MAMNVKFLKGTLEKYEALASKDAGTLYFITDTGAIYLGETLVADKTVLDQDQVNSLVADALKNFYTKAEIDGFLANYRTSADQDVIDNEIKASVKAISDDYLKGADKTKLEGKITAHETAVNTKFADYSTTAQMNAAIDADVKVVTDYIAEHEADWSAKTDISDLERRMGAVEKVADDAQTAKEVSDAIDNKITALNLATTYEPIGAEGRAKGYTDEEIIGLEFALSDDGKELSLKNKAGTAVATLDTTAFVKDGMISSVAISEDGANLVITWNTDAGISATTIPLTELVDVMTGVDGTTITVNVSADDKISAEVKTGSLKDGHIASDAAIAKGKLAADVQASLGKADTALQSHQSLDHLATKEYVGTVPSSATAKTVVGYIDEKIAEVDAAGVGQEIAGLKSTKADKVTDATSGNFAGLDANGNLTDSGKKAADFATAEQGAKADTAVQAVDSEIMPGFTNFKIGDETIIFAHFQGTIRSQATSGSASASLDQGHVRVDNGKTDSDMAYSSFAVGKIFNVNNKGQYQISLPEATGTLALVSEVEGAEQNAKDYADTKLQDYTKTADLGDLALLDNVKEIYNSDGYYQVTIGSDAKELKPSIVVKTSGGAGSASTYEFGNTGTLAVVSDVSTAESNAKTYADGLLAALRGAASADVTIEALVKAINKCIKGTEETTLQTASLTDNINNLDSRADAIEGALTWGTIGE